MKPASVFLHRPPSRHGLLQDAPPPAWNRLKSRKMAPNQKGDETAQREPGDAAESEPARQLED